MLQDYAELEKVVEQQCAPSGTLAVVEMDEPISDSAAQKVFLAKTVSSNTSLPSLWSMTPTTVRRMTGLRSSFATVSSRTLSSSIKMGTMLLGNNFPRFGRNIIFQIVSPQCMSSGWKNILEAILLCSRNPIQTTST